MAIRNLGWYDLQSQRPYPLSDVSTGVSDAGEDLPHDLLVDARIVFPNNLGDAAWLAGLTSGPGIVTAVFASCFGGHPRDEDDPMTGEGSFTLAAVSIPQPVEPYRAYPIRPLADGVGGWVVFGPGVERTWTGRFATPAQGLLLPRCAFAYRAYPVASLSKAGAAQRLSGIVELRAGADVELAVESRVVAGAARDCVIVRLASQPNRNAYAAYVGPCGVRPESATCPKTPLETINGVEPDCAGNLLVRFDGVTVAPFTGGGGLTVDLALGAGEACPPKNLPGANGELRIAEDQCYDGRPPLPPDPEDPVIDDGQDRQDSDQDGIYDRNRPVPSPPPLAPMPAPFLYSGFVQAATNLTVLVPGVGSGDISAYGDIRRLPAMPSGALPPLSNIVPLIAGSWSRRTIAYARPFSAGLLSAVTRTAAVMARPRIYDDLGVVGGVERNAGVVFGYREMEEDSLYWLALLDCVSSTLQIRRYDRGEWETLATQPISGGNVPPNRWYELRVGVVSTVGGYGVEFTMLDAEISGTAPTRLVWESSAFDGAGCFGVGTYNAWADFAVLYVT